MKMVNLKKMPLLLFTFILLILSVSSVFAQYDLYNNVVAAVIAGVSDTDPVRIGQPYSVTITFFPRRAISTMAQARRRSEKPEGSSVK